MKGATPSWCFAQNWVCAIAQLMLRGLETGYDMVVCAIFQLGYARHISQ